MPKQTRRATIYLDADIHRALKLKSAELDESVSELVNEAVRQSLRETEPEYPFEDFVRELKQSGRL